MAEAIYLEQGEGMVENLRAMLLRNGLALDRADSVLDFACGHGRVTRWLVETCGADRITASDINPQAVDFVSKTFKVAGLYSAEEAQSLTHERKYQVIFVASLFSHLSLKHWNEWAAQLASMLQCGGLLVFSTHGMGNYSKHRPDIQRRFAKLAEGFFYNDGNETLGRLAGDYYGTAYVAEEYVRLSFSKSGVGSVVDYIPHGLLEYQDLYAFRREVA
jgi:cyclopropane fatty-acyl-phospholipid synthase-like methyltransferase